MLETLATVAFDFFAVGYFVLGGADVGVGMLVPFLGRSADERCGVIRAIVPFFLVNEGWLAATAGVLVGAFLPLAGELLSGLFPTVAALVAGWVVRDMGLWLRDRATSARRRVLCDAAVIGGSWTVALSWGWMFAGLLAGITDRLVIDSAAVLVAFAIAALFAAHGLAFAGLRLSGALRERVRGLSGNSGEVRTFALTSAVMAALCLAAGFRLPLTESAAGRATLTLLLPAAAVVAPLLVAAQIWVWRVFRHDVSGRSCH